MKKNLGEIATRLYESPTFQRLLKRYSERTKGIVFFCGSGASAEAGLPTWPAFIGGLRRELTSPPYSTAAGSSLPERLSQVDNEQDYWRKVSIIKSLLGDAQYESAVKFLLTAKPNSSTTFYDACWSLKPKGILTVNLDMLAGNSFRSAGTRLNEVNGDSAHENDRVVNADSPFVVNLHGTVDTASSWILTAEERDRLLSQEGYKHFLRNIFTRYTVVFLASRLPT